MVCIILWSIEIYLFQLTKANNKKWETAHLNVLIISKQKGMLKQKGILSKRAFSVIWQ